MDHVAKWDLTGMLEFCGQEQCTLDSNHRLKLSPALLRDFQRQANGELVLFCLPEGALGLYPPATWETMRRKEDNPALGAGDSMLARRMLRRFGAFSQRVELSPQGRITIPSAFLVHAALTPQNPILLVGVEIGVELWQPERWSQEMALIQEYIVRKGDQEMASGLSRETGHA